MIIYHVVVLVDYINLLSPVENLILLQMLLDAFPFHTILAYTGLQLSKISFLGGDVCRAL